MELKTSLDHLPGKCRRELERIVEILFEEFDESLRRMPLKKPKKGRIVRIVLYGSFARGAFVIDPFSGPHSGYVSDYDILVTVNEKELTDFDYWTRANDHFNRYPSRGFTRPFVNLIVHTNRYVNRRISRGAYFFVDIAKEGIALYEAPRIPKLASPQPLTPKAALEEAQDNFQNWFPDAKGFFEGSKFFQGKQNLKLAAFSTHQAIEHAYRAFLLVMTNYAPSTHDIKTLRSKAEDINRRLIPVWPRYHRRDRRLFELARKAYVKARYSRYYSITEEELNWLGERVIDLHKQIASKCRNRLATLKRKVKAGK